MTPVCNRAKSGYPHNRVCRTDMIAEKFENMSENQWRILILATSGCVLLISFYCFLLDITTVFINLYYFPVIFLAYRYHKRGILLSAILGMVYLSMALYFQYSNLMEIVGALLRFISLVVVAIVIAYLSISVEKKQLAYQTVSEFNQSIISNANVWLTVLDAKGTILVWNEAAEEISGYSSEEVLGINSIWKKLYPEPEYRRKITGIIQYIIRDKKYFENFETTILAKNEKKKTILWNTRTIPDEQGRYNRFVAIGIDITERKVAEKALAESELRFRRTFETAKDGLLLLNKESGKITRVNPAISELLGYPADFFSGKTLDEVGLLNHVGGYEKIHETLNEIGFVFFSDVVVESQNGDRFDTEIYLVDRAIQVQCNVRDITSRKKTERELFRSNEELKSANEQLAAAEEELRNNYDDLFMSQQALDLARRKLNLLNSITFTDIQNAVFSLSGFLELEKLVPGGNKSTYLDREIGIVFTITETLKFASRYQKLGLMPPAWQNVMETFLLGISHLDPLQFFRTLDVKGLEIYADPLLENVFFTLTENVILHGKTVTGICLRYEDTPSGLTLFFEDNGVGIPGDLKEKIFDRRFEEKRGIGLFLTREILSVTGIRITETGEPGKGARFELLVPKEMYRIKDPE
jgi:PAS domain S-box-containing protein